MLHIQLEFKLYQQVVDKTKHCSVVCQSCIEKTIIYLTVLK